MSILPSLVFLAGTSSLLRVTQVLRAQDSFDVDVSLPKEMDGFCSDDDQELDLSVVSSSSKIHPPANASQEFVNIYHSTMPIILLQRFPSHY